MFVTLPQQRTFVHECNLISDFEDGVHIVGVDNCRHVELLSQVADELVDKDRCIWV